MSVIIPIINTTTTMTIISVTTIMTMITICTILPAIHPSLLPYLARVLMYCFTVDRGSRVVKAKSSILPLSVPPLSSAVQCSLPFAVPFTVQ